MKKLLILFMVITCLFGGYSISSASENEDSKEIVKLLKAVYKEKNKKFLKFDNKEKRETILKYYKRYFTDEMSMHLTINVEVSRKHHRTGAFIYDPRYGNDFGYEPENGGWYPTDEDRNVKKIEFLAPRISGNKAVAKVDYLIAPGADDDIMRSEYHLIKTSNGWKIDNIFWGPQENFEHGVTQSIFHLK